MHHRKVLVELYQCTKFRVASSKFPKSNAAHAYAYAYALAQHVHHAPNHQMACTIELRSLSSISVPNLVSIAQSFLKPEDPSRINLSGPGARILHRTGTVTTKTYSLG